MEPRSSQSNSSGICLFNVTANLVDFFIWYCWVSKQLVVIKRLDVICNSTKGKLDSDDSKVAPIVAGLTSMFSSICSDHKAAFNGRLFSYNVTYASFS